MHLSAYLKNQNLIKIYLVEGKAAIKNNSITDDDDG